MSLSTLIQFVLSSSVAYCSGRVRITNNYKDKHILIKHSLQGLWGQQANRTGRTIPYHEPRWGRLIRGSPPSSPRSTTTDFPHRTGNGSIQQQKMANEKKHRPSDPFLMPKQSKSPLGLGRREGKGE